jgi:hypothetical protein
MFLVEAPLPAKHFYQRPTDYLVSSTDPDATTMQPKGGVDSGYHAHYVVDGGKARLMLHLLVTPTARDGQSTLAWVSSGEHVSAGNGQG